MIFFFEISKKNYQIQKYKRNANSVKSYLFDGEINLKYSFNQEMKDFYLLIFKVKCLTYLCKLHIYSIINNFNFEIIIITKFQTIFFTVQMEF